MRHAYRLLYRESLDAPDSLWEWHQPWIDHLLWHARTFGREVVHCYFATWQALDRANTRLWETTDAPWARSARWPTWHAWLVDYREWLVITRDGYEGHPGSREQSATLCPPGWQGFPLCGQGCRWLLSRRPRV